MRSVAILDWLQTGDPTALASMMSRSTGRRIISPSILTKGNSTTDGTSFSTASISPGANRLVIVAISSAQSLANPVPPSSVAGAGLTFTKLADVDYDVVSPGANLSFWYALSATPGSGALTIDYGAQTTTSVCWQITQYANVDTSGVNGLGAIRQSKVGTPANGTTHTVTLDSAFEHANNIAVGIFGGNAANTWTAGTGFTMDSQSVSTPSTTVGQEYSAANDTTVDATFGATADLCGIAVELKAAAA